MQLNTASDQVLIKHTYPSTLHCFSLFYCIGLKVKVLAICFLLVRDTRVVEIGISLVPTTNEILVFIY
jgi:hypothetical protein